MTEMMAKSRQFPAASAALRGFTLVELVAALAILAVLASVSIAPIKLERQRAKERELRAALTQIREALDAYKRMSDDKRIPMPSADASGYPPSLDALAQGVRDASKPGAAPLYLLRRVPRDPFHPDASIPAARTWGLRSYASPPDRPAPGADVFDVYSLADGAGLNGVPYRQW
jgi:general secretion pathway protein G